MHRKGRVPIGVVDEALRSALASFLTDKVGWKKPANHEAFDAFDTLVSKDCDGVFLASMLEILADVHRLDTWQGLYGFSNSDTLRTSLKRLRLCADDIEHLLGGVIGKSLLHKPSELVLSDHLRDVAGQFERVRKSIKPRNNLTGRAARAAIVLHVHDKTGSFNDELVARILSPALGTSDAVAQTVWRSENSALISLLRRQ